MKCATALVIAALSLPTHSADTLPVALKGRWYGVGGGGSKNNYDVALSDLKQSPDGSVAGKLTRFGNGCGANGEPINGSFDGTTLKLESMSRAGVNTRRMGGDCGLDKYVLKREDDGKFVGTLEDKQGNSFTVELSP